MTLPYEHGVVLICKVRNARCAAVISWQADAFSREQSSGPEHQGAIPSDPGPLCGARCVLVSALPCLIEALSSCEQRFGAIESARTCQEFYQASLVRPLPSSWTGRRAEFRCPLSSFRLDFAAARSYARTVHARSTIGSHIALFSEGFEGFEL